MLKKTYLILTSYVFIFASTASCASFPTKFRYVIDLNAQKCTQWQLDPVTLKSIGGSAIDFPLQKCNGFIATDPAEYVKEMQFDVSNCGLKPSGLDQPESLLLPQSSTIQAEK